MQKVLLTLLALFFSIFSFGQPTATNDDHFVLKGKIQNYPHEFWEFGLANFIDFETVSVPLNENGEFFKKLPLRYTQDVFLNFEDHSMALFVVPGDTIEISCNYKSFDRTFRATSLKPWRQKELDLMTELFFKFHVLEGKVEEEIHDRKIPDSIKYNRIKSYYSDRANIAGKFPLTINSRKIFCDIYYRAIDKLLKAGMLSKYSLSYSDLLPKNAIDALALQGMDVRTIDESLFYVSNVYRDFIFDRVRFYKPFTGYRLTSQSYSPFNFTLEHCYAGAATLSGAPNVLDWFLTKAIISGFGSYSFEGSEKAYQFFFPQIKNTIFKDTLQKFYQNIQRLKPGSAAPAFVLKDAKGNEVSLSSFKGKIVYIDFWGVYCGPCIFDIKNDIPQLHKKYQNKEVVFINVCVDVDEKKWKESIENLKLDGINLIAEGWTEHQVCKDYNVNAVPHYVLIDKNGNMIQNNANRPYELLQNRENEIDKLLKNK